jgi:hypothetical protein
VSLAAQWTVEELRHQVGASEHMLRVAQRDLAAAPECPDRQAAVADAARWLQRFRDWLTDAQAQAHRRAA